MDEVLCLGGGAFGRLEDQGESFLEMKVCFRHRTRRALEGNTSALLRCNSTECTLVLAFTDYTFIRGASGADIGTPALWRAVVRDVLTSNGSTSPIPYVLMYEGKGGV